MFNNNLALVEYVKKALAEKWGYVWGTFGQVLTEELLTQKRNQYPVSVGHFVEFIRANWMGKKVADCVGLIKGFYWTNAEGKMMYNATSDVNTEMMYARAMKKGPIEGMPDVPGIILYKNGHVGVYIGNGEVIEAHATKIGVIKTPLADGTRWTHWMECPYINYSVQSVKPPSPPSYDFKRLQALIGAVQDNVPGPETLGRCPVIKIGVKSEVVRWMQTRLNFLGFNCGMADGDFGPMTDTAVKAFQRNRGLVVDGIVGKNTWTKLLGL